MVNYEALQKVAYFNSISANIGSTSTPLFGGYAGGAEGVAVLATSYLIMGNLIYRGSYHYNAPLHQNLRMSSTKPLLWAIGMSNQANARNMRYPVVNLPYLGGGAGTKMYHYEMAAYTAPQGPPVSCGNRPGRGQIFTQGSRTAGTKMFRKIRKLHKKPHPGFYLRTGLRFKNQTDRKRRIP